MWNDDEDESCGYVDMAGDAVFAGVTVAIITVIAMMVWAFKGAF